MRRFIFAILILFVAATSIAQTNREETAYTPPSPFSPFAESYQYNVQRLYESLPEINSTANIPGTDALVNAELKNILSGTKTWTYKQGAQTTYWTGSNLTPIGKHTIEVRNLDSNYYFWCIYGKVQLFIKNTFRPNDTPTRTVQNYFIVLHFKRGNAKAHIDYFSIGNAVITNNTQTLDLISKEATARLTRANKEAYEKVIRKREWTINNRIELGNFHGYRNGRVVLTKDDARTVHDITRFAYDDQVLIRGYIDHQGIPVRDIPRPGN